MIFWRTFQTTNDDTFTSAIDELIAYHRSSPMVEEVAKAIDTAKKRERASRDESASLLTTLKQASQKSPNKEYARMCVSLIEKKFKGELTTEQFFEGCNYLEKVAALSVL